MDTKSVNLLIGRNNELAIITILIVFCCNPQTFILMPIE